MATVNPEDLGRYVSIANGLALSMTRHEDQFTNLAHAQDIFGVFMLDHDLNRVGRPIAWFSSPRVGDYDAWIVRTTADSVVICGRGAMYGDELRRWAFPLDSLRSAESARVRDSILRNPPPASDNQEGYERDEAVSPAPDCPGIVAK